jgi:hypothetical protein
LDAKAALFPTKAEEDEIATNDARAATLHFIVQFVLKWTEEQGREGRNAIGL